MLAILRSFSVVVLATLLLAAPARAQVGPTDPTPIPSVGYYQVAAGYISDDLIFKAVYSEVPVSRRVTVQQLEVYVKSAKTAIVYEVARNGVPFAKIQVDSHGYGSLVVTAPASKLRPAFPFFAPGDVISVGPGEAKFNRS